MSQQTKESFISAIKYIHENLDKPIVLDDIARASSLSLSSLKRVFVEATNQSVGSFVRRLRMERAFRTLKNKDMSVLEVALSSGFEDHSAFARSFKESFGYSPTFARQKLNIVSELDSIVLEEPEIVEIEKISLQVVTKVGTYFTAAPDAWGSLQAQLRPEELDDDFAGMYIGIGHDNPHEGEVVENQVRFSAGVALCARDLNIEKIVLKECVYAKFNFTGKLPNLGLAYHYIFGKWAENPTKKINHQIPTFMMFDKFPNGFSEQKVAIYVPIMTQQAL